MLLWRRQQEISLKRNVKMKYERVKFLLLFFYFKKPVNYLFQNGYSSRTILEKQIVIPNTIIKKNRRILLSSIDSVIVGISIL